MTGARERSGETGLLAVLRGFADRHVSPMAGLGVAVLAVSTSAVLIEASDAPKPAMAFYRVLFTTLLLAPFAWEVRGEFRAIEPRDLLSATLAGAALAAHFATWFESIGRTSIAASVALVQTQPAFVAAGAFLLLDESLSRRTVAGIAVAGVGSTAMVLEGLLAGASGTAPAAGNALALAGAVMAAGYVLAGRAIRQRVSLVPYVLVVYGVCTLVLLAYVLAVSAPLAGYPGHEWGLFLAMAVGPGILGHTVVNWALEYVESSVVSVTLIAEPVGATILAFLVFRAVPTVLTVLGGSVVLAGVFLAATSRE